MKLSLVNILENVFVFIEILLKMLLFKGGVLIYTEHCILRENNERLNFSYQYFMYSSFEKGIFYYFSVVINFSYATVISNNSNCQI